MQLKVIEIVFKNFIVKEMWFRNPWKSPAESQGSVEQSLSATVVGEWRGGALN
jgi:hypothetical protein